MGKLTQWRKQLVAADELGEKMRDPAAPSQPCFPLSPLTFPDPRC